jgi:hypothetical protein
VCVDIGLATGWSPVQGVLPYTGSIYMVFTVLYYPNSHPSILYSETSAVKDHLRTEWFVVFLEMFHSTTLFTASKSLYKTSTCFPCIYVIFVCVCQSVCNPVQHFSATGNPTSCKSQLFPTRRRSGSIDMFKRPGTARIRRTAWNSTQHAQLGRNDATWTWSSHARIRKKLFCSKNQFIFINQLNYNLCLMRM